MTRAGSKRLRGRLLAAGPVLCGLAQSTPAPKPPDDAASVPVFQLIAEASQGASKVVDGVQVKAKDWPALVTAVVGTQLESGRRVPVRCSGALVGPGTLLTAAHCFDPGTEEPFRTEARIGLSAKEPIPLKCTVAPQYANSPEFSAIPRVAQDYALCYFDEPGDVMLPAAESVDVEHGLAAGAAVVMAGWGCRTMAFDSGHWVMVDERGESEMTLTVAEGTLDTVPTPGATKFDDSFAIIVSNLSVAGHHPALCKGDSGGPLFSGASASLAVALAVCTTPALPQSTPGSKAAIAACEDPSLEGIDVKLDRPTAVADTVDFEDELLIKYSGALRHTAKRLEVWVNGRQQLSVEGQVLESFEPKDFAVSIPIVVKVSQEPDEKGRFTLKLSPDSSNEVTVILHTAPSGSKAGCGIETATLKTRRVGDFGVAVGFNYSDKDYALKYAQADAEAIAEHFMHDMKLRPENVWLLTDDDHPATPPKGVNVRVVKNLTGIESALKELWAVADRRARLYFYYSGHMTIGSGPYIGEPYFLMPDSDPDTFTSQYQRLALLKQLLLAPFAGTVVIVDACYSGSVDVQEAHRRGTASLPGIKSLRAPVGDISLPSLDSGHPRAILSSSKGLAPSWELGEGVQHGVFTYHLLKAGDAKPSMDLSQAYHEALGAMQAFKFKPTDQSEELIQIPDGDIGHGTENWPWKEQ